MASMNFRFGLGMLTACLVSSIVSQASADVVTVVATADTGIGLRNGDGEFSNGAGSFLVVGRTNEMTPLGLRRSLFFFDVAGNIPAGAIVNSVQFECEVITADNVTMPVTLFTLLEDWSEGPSSATNGQLAAAGVGDADWDHATHDSVSWTTPGGEFDMAALSTTNFTATGPGVLGTSAAFVNTVQSWLDAPATNFGFIAVGDESMNETTVVLASREDANAAFHPRLVIDFDVPPAPGDLVISEVMPNPNVTDDAVGEWFEIHNRHPTADIDLDGWTISDAGGDSHTINTTLVVSAGGYVVLARDGDAMANGGISGAYEYSGFLLGNDADEIILTDPGTTEWDRVEWTDATFPDPDGATMTLDPNFLDTTANDAGTNWCEARSAFGDGDLGTPGAANDECDEDMDGFHYDVDCVDVGMVDGVPAASINPNGTEVAGNDADEDCNTNLDCFEDLDGDTFGSTTVDVDAVVAGGTCDDFANNVADDDTDCADAAAVDGVAAADINPNGTEVAGNDADEDCNTNLDCFEDLDGDTFGSTTVDVDAVTASGTCDDAANNVADDDTDCADAAAVDGVAAADINTSGTEVAGNDADEDCNMSLDCFTDADGDGFGSTVVATDGAAATATCDDVSNNLADDDTDCADDDIDVNPSETEVVCDGTDNDCDTGTPDDDGSCGGMGGMGGMGTGGMATGGMATGGMATGGMATGGMATGGAATGGSATGGMGTGGTSSGGNDGDVAEGGGCNCSTPGDGSAPSGLAAFGLLFAMALRRRRD